MGGEYVSGPPSFFRELASEIDAVLPTYFRVLGTGHHVGDEAYTSAALERLRRKGRHVADAGTLGIVGRYWNAKTLHPQKPLAYFERCFLLHLPADKALLSALGRSGRDWSEPGAFLGEYRARSRPTLTARLRRRLGRVRDLLLRR
jgi:hypothetical protein